MGKKGFELDESGRVNRTVGGGREYLLHVPGGYDGEAAAVVLGFHGGESGSGTVMREVIGYGGRLLICADNAAGGRPERQESLSQFSLDRHRINNQPIIAAYPLGAPNSDYDRTAIWTSAPYANTTADDVGY